MKKNIIVAICLTQFLMTQGQQTGGPTMDIEVYQPTSTLVVPETEIIRARYPFIDVHSHQWNLTKERIARLVEEMDSLNMAVMVNLSGRGFNRADRDIGTQEYLASMVRRTKGEAEGRFIIFTNVSFKNFGAEGWQENALRELEEDVENGANGLKIYKSLGLRNADINGKRITVDHPLLDPIWAKCGELGIPVLIHSADPEPFWQPFDEKNERWLELKLRPNRQYGEDVAPFDKIIAEQHNVFARHPNTTFINAHMGWMANDLEKLSRHLDTYPNVYVGIGAVIAELGRQPRMAKKFFESYQDRVLFAKDAYNQEEFYTYFRVLESEDDYFPYYKYHAFWAMYGIGLSDEVLKKLYYKNALSIIPNIDTSRFPE